MAKNLSGSNNSEGFLEAEMSTSDDNTSRGSSSKLSDFEEVKVEVVQQKSCEDQKTLSFTQKTNNSEEGYTCLRLAGLPANHNQAKAHMIEFFSTCEGFLPESCVFQRQ
jgi:hypothetical protein